MTSAEIVQHAADEVLALKNGQEAFDAVVQKVANRINTIAQRDGKPGRLIRLLNHIEGQIEDASLNNRADEWNALRAVRWPILNALKSF